MTEDTAAAVTPLAAAVMPAQRAPLAEPLVAPPTPGRMIRDSQLRALLVGQGLSNFGDQTARVAVAVLVFARSHSPVLSAASLAASYLPWVVAAPLLAGLGDRLPRRLVMVSADAYRCLAALALAVPGEPVWLVIALVFLLTCADPPFMAARSALLPAMLERQHYVAAHSLQQTVGVLTNFAGYAVGGFVVAGVGARPAFLIDAATFAASGLLLRLSLTSPAALDRSQSPRPGRGWSVVLANRQARWALGFGASLYAVDAVNVGVVVPWAHELGGGAGLVGVLVASGVLGAACGNATLSRLSEESRARLLMPMALVNVALLVPFLGLRSVAPTIALLVVSGALTCFQIVVNQRFVLAMPSQMRARAFGVAGSVINLAQGAAVLLGGVLADRLAPSTVVGLSGVLGIAVVFALGVVRPRSEQPVAPAEDGDHPSE